jgi:hypothetical protein
MSYDFCLSRPLLGALVDRHVVALRRTDVELARTPDLLSWILDHLLPLRDPACGARHREKHSKHGHRKAHRVQRNPRIEISARRRCRVPCRGRSNRSSRRCAKRKANNQTGEARALPSHSPLGLTRTLPLFIARVRAPMCNRHDSINRKLALALAKLGGTIGLPFHRARSAPL